MSTRIKKIPGYSYHYISTDGRVFSADYNHTGRWKEMKLQVQKDTGYLLINLSENGNYQKRYVHHLVLETFAPEQKEEARKKAEEQDSVVEVRHLNGDKQDNRLENLKWGTAKENGEDAVRLKEKKGVNQGTKQHLAKLNEERVRTIRDLKDSDLTYQEIADKFGISRSRAWMVANRKSWSWVE